MSDDSGRIKTERCEHCLGLGRVPSDPELSAADLRAEITKRLTSGPGAASFAARVERKKAEARQAGRA